jgi:hypothetical protein
MFFFTPDDPSAKRLGVSKTWKITNKYKIESLLPFSEGAELYLMQMDALDGGEQNHFLILSFGSI